jgi:peptide/nickel transport system permease protein
MQQYIASRVLLFIPTMVLLTLIVFLLLRIMPGDPAKQILGGATGEGSYTQEDLANLQHKLGTDRPLHVQYGTWIWDLLRGDLGNSYIRNKPIIDHLKLRLPLTVELTVIGVLISFVLAVPLGILSALKQNTFLDYLSRIICFTGIAIPTFVTGLVTMYLLVKIFNWFPPLDYKQLWEDPAANLSQMIFPALALAFFLMAFIARVTRSAMLEILREDYIRTARAKGLRERRVIFLHALQNSFLPILTVAGWAFGVLLG